MKLKQPRLVTGSRVRMTKDRLRRAIVDAEQLERFNIDTDDLYRKSWIYGGKIFLLRIVSQLSKLD